MNFHVTHIGTATLLIEVGSLRFLTDPVFDAAGGEYQFGWGTGSTKLTDPAVVPQRLGPVDAVLLSHDQHEDNLDRSGRAFLPQAKRVLTTTTAAKRLQGNAEGLHVWQSVVVGSGEGAVTVTAVPARHGPPLVHWLSGPTIGFVLEWAGQKDGALYISGDTVYFSGIRKIARRFTVGTGFFHLGKAGFALSGSVRFTMNSADGVKAARALSPKVFVPIHYEGWKHFREGREALDVKLRNSVVGDRLCWLELGRRTAFDVQEL